MTAKPLLHPATAALLEITLQHPPHALLIAAPTGSGKATVAHWLAHELLANTRGYYEIAPQAGKAISIEAIRELEHITSLKMPGNDEISRVIVIIDAHTMTIEAQNALLKTLEEPPAGTMLILTSAHQDMLLPTIRSRAQSIELTRPSQEDLSQLLAARGAKQAEINNALALSGGLPGLACSLVDNNLEHPLVQAAQTARQLLQQSSFEKLCQVEALAKNKEASTNLVYILSQMAHAAVLTGKAGERWQRVMQAAYDAEVALNGGAQPKLVMSNLMLSL